MWRLWPRRRAAIKNYDDLRADVIVPRLLVVVCVPEDCEGWTRQTEEHLCLRHCAYWLSLAGMPETDNVESVTVRIPRNQIFSVPLSIIVEDNA